MIKIAINGFGRIGRIFFRQAFGNPDIDIIAVNDLGSPENLAYLLKYDTVYGRYDRGVGVNDNKLVIGPASHEASQDGKNEVLVLSEKDPSKLPWKDLGVDIVIESTGVFDSRNEAAAHLNAGAKRVVITAPAKDEVTPTATPNVFEDVLRLDKITANASCTTNAINPVAAIMLASPGIKKAMLNTIHGYTATQGLVDGPDRKGDFRRARAAAQNIVPSTTGAAKATARVIKELEGKFDGIAIRVPVISGSLIDFTFLASRNTSVEEINSIFKEAAAKPEWQGILTVTEDPIVSSDILKNPYGSVVDLALTRVVDGDLVKVFAWYDNEWGYCAMLLKHVLAVSQIL
ncbi:MAG: type I glyceraldehyde-3-phosphate dehydrogenase [Candidatus Yanofskybacteria bacterium RIFCSPHIGHO2_01_FULL_44_17]|uniref:Type I glyceraldehyde-3-phosphate dehydrogenase n=1 Tax=Candidatus Yanofskybacteria bacterium RIFCSPHIGHO2_01_FULL_44_17 TaxID=1802668 RepID=A0A1F8F0N5_9BACT|nr:MAG: type I glyceraldehyde-3-phosphate dehydrogenase [Candidatus Yanofskybacteria bacterium RIFCSPHIGHO2_01_FULL_44_17]